MDFRAPERIVYCKNGDVAEELRLLGPDPQQVPPGGPTHYISSFLHWSRGAPLLVISHLPRADRARAGRVEARVIARRSWMPGPPGRAWAATTAFLKTLGAILRFRPTWIFCAKSGPSLWACFVASRVLGAPLVHSRHNRVEVPKGSGLRALGAQISGWMIRRCAAVIGHGPYVLDQLRAIGVPAERLREFNLSYRHLLAPPDPEAAIPDLTAGGSRRVMVFVGRVQEDKGVFDLLEALAPRLREDASLRLAYAGDGPALERLRAAVREQALDQQVELLGQVQYAVLTGLLRQAHAVVIPTRRRSGEGRCKAAIEALVIGRPVIAPNAGLFPYMIEHERNGLLYAEDSVPDLRRQLERVLDDAALHAQLLDEGARYSRRQLLDSTMTFQDALQWSYEASVDALPARRAS